MRSIWIRARQPLPFLPEQMRLRVRAIASNLPYQSIREIPSETTNKKKEMTALYVASKKGNVEIVTFLLAKNAAWNEKEALTPLHPAAQKGHTAIVELLLNEGGIPPTHRVRDRDPTAPPSPLLLATSRGKTEVVELL